jgi:hypothetical protein
VSAPAKKHNSIIQKTSADYTHSSQLYVTGPYLRLIAGENKANASRETKTPSVCTHNTHPRCAAVCVLVLLLNPLAITRMCDLQSIILQIIDFIYSTQPASSSKKSVSASKSF